MVSATWFEGAHLASRGKILAIDQLSAVAADAHGANKVVVLAHGSFDLLHLGHVRHLEQARAQGDLLLVTITADDFVNKGPGRPVFSAMQRAEMLAALSCVDWVAVNDAPTAVPALYAIKPDVYVKGPDYLNPADDITGKIVDERRAVEACGGRIHFTDDIVFSSSSLLNRYFDQSDPALRAYLQPLRENNVLPDLIRIVERASRLRVLVVGDAIVNERNYVRPLGDRAEGGVTPVEYLSSELIPGGVLAAANHIAGFCATVDVLTCVGDQDDFGDFIKKSLKPNVSLFALQRPGAPTTRKRRYIERDRCRTLFEVQLMDDSPLYGELETSFVEHIERMAPQYDAVIVTDFGHGLLTVRAIQALIGSARFLAVNAQSNSSNMGFNLISKYPKADYACVEGSEARLAVGDKHAEIKRIAAALLPARVGCARFVIMQHPDGCTISDCRENIVRSIPGFAKQPLDTTEAETAFFALTSPLVAADEDLEFVGIVGNAAWAMSAGMTCNPRAIEKTALLKYLTALLK